ncbi:hypothetical protein PC112_g7935 [Phytophthora cactorum]|nr:hypothetical protein PC112_g7935 [Phytophthora cactorum]
MKKAQVHCDTKEFQHNVSRTVESDRYMTAQRTLLLAWVVAGVIPFILQLRSYLKFASPHKITQNLVVPYGLEKETESLGDVCPVEGMLLAGSWFNIEPTHYFTTDQGRLCHFVIPQYNVHGTFLIGNKSIEPYYTTPTSCMNSSLEYSQYFYHGSIGYYSFYEEQTGSYCQNDHTAYIVGQGLVSALKSFGLLKVNEKDGTEFLVFRKIRWFRVLRDDLFVFAAVSNHRVEPCDERPRAGVVGFCDRRLGGPLVETGTHHPLNIHVKHKENC